MVVVEALASGKPVVATRSGGPETILDEKSGVIVKPGDPDSLVKGIKRIMEGYSGFHPEEIRKKAINRFSTEMIAERVLKVYKKVVAAQVDRL